MPINTATEGGYEDGFAKGKSDVNDNQPREFANSDAYNRADRTYQPRMGTLPEYQEGYRIGFELGYNDGYFARPYTISMPANLGKVVIASVNASIEPIASENSRPRATDDRRTRDDRDDRYNSDPVDRGPDRAPTNSRPSSTSSSRGTVNIPDGLSMKVRLNDQINTRTNREGDRFTAIVLDPSDYADAVVEGHIAKLNKSGKASGKTELSLVFDTIRTARRTQRQRWPRRSKRFTKAKRSRALTKKAMSKPAAALKTQPRAARAARRSARSSAASPAAAKARPSVRPSAAASASVRSYIEGGKELVLEPGTEMLLRTAAPARTRD